MLCVAVILLLQGFAGTVSAAGFTPAFELKSEAAMLISLDTGEVLYEKNADAQVMPAQLVNIMVAILCLESCDNISGTSITADNALFHGFADYEFQSDLRYGEIHQGDTLTVEELLYCMMLTSSVEASMMLADHFGDGSVSAFVAEMNTRAQALGATNTVFANPHGLYDPVQVTTARDMVLLTRYALDKVPNFRKIATTNSFSPTITKPENHPTGTWTWTHSNTMTMESSENYFKGAAGIKTGNLQKAGRNLITIASRDGNSYLAIVMQAPMYDENQTSHYYHLEEATALLKWAFEHFTFETILSDSEEIAEVSVENAGGDTNYVIIKPSKEIIMLWPDTLDRGAIQRIITKEDSVKAPVKAGDKLGTVELKLAGETLGKADLIASGDVEQSFLRFNASAILAFPRSRWLKVAILISVLLTAAYIGLCILCAKGHRRRAAHYGGLGLERKNRRRR